MKEDKLFYFAEELGDNLNKKLIENLNAKKIDIIGSPANYQEGSFLKSAETQVQEKANIADNKLTDTESNIEHNNNSKDFMKKIIGSDPQNTEDGDIYDLPFSEIIKILNTLNDKGNEHMKNKEYDDASLFYAKALIHFYYIP